MRYMPSLTSYPSALRAAPRTVLPAAGRAVPWASFATALALAASSQAQPDTWKEGARLPAARSEMRAAVIDGIIYVPGGFGATNQLAAYDPVADTATSLKPVPRGLDHHMVEAFGGKLYVLKRVNAEEGTWIYTPSTDTWESRKPGRWVRSDGTAVTLGNHIYLIGGQGVGPIERYAPATDSWEELSSLPILRGHVQAVVLDGKIWVLGGRAGTLMHKSVDIFNPVDGTWTKGPDMEETHSGHAAAVVGGRIIVAGGEVLVNGTPIIRRSVEIYDPAVGRWVRGRDMPTPLHGVASVAFGGKMYVLGGSYQPYVADNSNQTFRYEPPAGGSPVLRPPGRLQGRNPRRPQDRSGTAWRVGSEPRLVWVLPAAAYPAPGSLVPGFDALGGLRPVPHGGAR